MPHDSPELSSHGFIRGGFPGEPVFCPLLLPVGLDAAMGLFFQHLAAWKLDLGCNSLAQEVCVTLSGIRYRDREQRCPRVLLVARQRPIVKTESPGENRCRHMALRETSDIRGRQQLGKAVSILGSGFAEYPVQPGRESQAPLRPKRLPPSRVENAFRGHCRAWHRPVLAEILRLEQIPGDSTKPVGVSDRHKTAIDDGPDNRG